MAKPKRLFLGDDLLKALGLCLRNLRESKRPGLSAAKIAKELGVSPATLSDYETGKREPGLGFIHIAARAYKVHPNVILGVAHMKEFDFSGALDADAAGVLRVQDILDILSPDILGSVRHELERLGYKRG